MILISAMEPTTSWTVKSSNVAEFLKILVEVVRLGSTETSENKWDTSLNNTSSSLKKEAKWENKEKGMADNHSSLCHL